VSPGGVCSLGRSHRHEVVIGPALFESAWAITRIECVTATILWPQGARRASGAWTWGVLAAAARRARAWIIAVRVPVALAVRERVHLPPAHKRIRLDAPAVHRGARQHAQEPSAHRRQPQVNGRDSATTFRMQVGSRDRRARRCPRPALWRKAKATPTFLLPHALRRPRRQHGLAFRMG
jgi:hypothetical protein